ncbi:MAG: histidine--tRNA ligase [Candidatus Parcubacteria bacterium]|nr:histidine--tRNA ligase [Candidatus Parcubacteria bacterium]
MTENKKKTIPRRPSGFPELLPGEQISFNRILQEIKDVYESFGFSPIETPALELSEVLLAKSAGDTEKQIYRFTKGDNDLALHFDLTVPFARYVAEHFSELTFPFRRYQIQKVWRAERAQKGRFREFLQCDVDIIGTKNMASDAEMLSVIFSVFQKIPSAGNFTVRISNKNILTGFLENLGLDGITSEILRSIDKMEKIGEAGVLSELSLLNVSDANIEQIFSFLRTKGTNREILEKLASFKILNNLFLLGISELNAFVSFAEKMKLPQENYKIDLTITRGLDYYTGTVYETILNDYPELGSVCSGGRYDNLVGYYSSQSLSGVGVSIGLTRLFSKLKEIDNLTVKKSSVADVLIIHMSEDLFSVSHKIATDLRKSGIPTDEYLETAKIQKQMTYANKLGIPFVVILGSNEEINEMVTVKEMSTGLQSLVKQNNLAIWLKDKR